MLLIDQARLDDLTAKAQRHPRRRQNWNIHPTDDFCCHRLLNAVEPGSYIRPHRHLDPNKNETFLILCGRLGALLFSDEGQVEERILLEAGGSHVALDIPFVRYHGALSLSSGTIFFEAKAGPYLPLTEDERAPWAPPDGSPGTAAYLAALESLF